MPFMPHRTPLTLAVLPLMLLSGVLGGGWFQTVLGADEVQTKSAIRHLKNTITPQRDESHLARLISLRNLGDPTQERLYLRLIQHDSWQVQVFAVLGLAKLSKDGNIMPWLVTQVQPQAQDQILAIAIDEQLLGPKEIVDLLDWKGLEEANRLALLAYQRSIDEDVAASAVLPMTESDNEKVVAAAWLVLAWLGDESAMAHITEVIEELPESRQLDILLTIIMLVNRYEIMEAVEWLDDSINSFRSQSRFPAVVNSGTATLLGLAPDVGMPHWRKVVGSQSRRRDQINASLILLQVGAPLPDEDRSRLDTEDDLVGSIIAAGNAVANSRDDAPDLMIELIDLNHIRSTMMLPRVIDTMPDDQAKIVLTHFLERMKSGSFSDLDQFLAIDATERLLKLDPGYLLDQLGEVEDDSPLQEAMLYGLLSQRAPGSLEAVQSIRRIGLSRPDALALLLIARDADELDDTQVQNLGLIVSGGVLSEHLQAQASWLYLKHTDQLEEAMVHLIPEAS